MNGICMDVPRHNICSYLKHPSELPFIVVRSVRSDPQVVLSLVDQHYFGSREAAAGMALPPPPGTTASDRMPLTSMIWQQVAQQYSSIPHCPGGSRVTGRAIPTGPPAQ